MPKFVVDEEVKIVEEERCQFMHMVGHTIRITEISEDEGDIFVSGVSKVSNERWEGYPSRLKR